MCGSPQGWMNTPNYYQNRLVCQILRPLGLFNKAGAGCIQWIDDSLLHHETKEGLLDIFEKFLERLAKFNVKLSIDKCDLFKTEIEYCGRVITGGKWRFSPELYEKITSAGKPRSEAEMGKIVWLMTWLAPAIPNLASIRERLGRGINLTGKASEIKRRNRLVI